MNKLFLTGTLLLCLIFTAVSQNHISGIVKGETSDNKLKALPGASVHWAGTSGGVMTNSDGTFEIHQSEKSHILVLSYTGFRSDSIHVHHGEYVKAVLKQGVEIEEITVEEDLGEEYHFETSIEAKTSITGKGLEKLPCCNLSESFENNATVDVSYSDAVSGAKQIRMLGLAGVYTQIMRENIPAIRGLAANYGLTHVPGPWMDAVQISKGAASVKNGYESVTGQINLEYKKPEKAERFYLNLFGNQEGRAELNSYASHKFNEKLSTMLFVHGNMLDRLHDENGDGFTDMPSGKNLNVLNRWKFSGEQIKSQIGINIMGDKRTGGQIPELSKLPVYSIEHATKKAEIFAKLGFKVPGTKHGSIGSMYSASYYQHRSKFGNKDYSGVQKSLYANIVYETIISNTNHKLETGFSYQYDDYTEMYNESDFMRSEKVPGVFTQYTYKRLKALSISAGIRADYHNLFGLFFTPRIHGKYSFSNGFTLRASAGKAYRSPNIFAENIGIFASSRKVQFPNEHKQEEAINYGGNFSWKPHFAEKQKLRFAIDFYRTDFQNMLIADVDASANEILFYNSGAEAFSNSFQTEVSASPFEGFSFTGAYRFNDVKANFKGNGLMQKPFVKRHKALLTLSYKTPPLEKWKFDITNQFHGAARIPDLSGNPAAGHFETRSPAYYMLHAQITKKFRKFELYAGGENILNFKQENPIIDPQNPFGENFDASMVWGPINGRILYAGIRIKIK